jgi:hypothetical protein
MPSNTNRCSEIVVRTTLPTHFQRQRRQETGRLRSVEVNTASVGTRSLDTDANVLKQDTSPPQSRHYGLGFLFSYLQKAMEGAVALDESVSQRLWSWT